MNSLEKAIAIPKIFRKAYKDAMRGIAMLQSLSDDDLVALSLNNIDVETLQTLQNQLALFQPLLEDMQDNATIMEILEPNSRVIVEDE